MMMRSFRFRNNAACMYQSVRRFSSGRTAQQTANAVAYLLPTQTATEDAAALHSSVRELQDVHLISGTLGAGKSTFCRAYIRYACDDEELAVPSPTYTLLNTYKEEIAEGPQIHHLDMYRLNSAAGQHRLQLPELWLSGATLIEWPERLEQKPEAYFATQISTCSQGDAAALQVLAREWATGAAPEPPGSDPGGEDQRWRVLTITGHGIDVGVRHTAGMRELAEQRIEPDFIVVPQEGYSQLFSLQSVAPMATLP